MIELPNTQYKWKNWDCFSLANWFRTSYELETLPDISEIYEKHSEKLPPELITDYLKKYAYQKHYFSNFALVCFEVNKQEALGTYYRGRIIYMGDVKATFKPIERMQPYIKSIWGYKCPMN